MQNMCSDHGDRLFFCKQDVSIIIKTLKLIFETFGCAFRIALGAF